MIKQFFHFGVRFRIHTVLLLEDSALCRLMESLLAWSGRFLLLALLFGCRLCAFQPSNLHLFQEDSSWLLSFSIHRQHAFLEALYFSLIDPHNDGFLCLHMLTELFGVLVGSEFELAGLHSLVFCRLGADIPAYVHWKFIVFCPRIWWFWVVQNLRFFWQEIVPRFGSDLLYNWQVNVAFVWLLE